MTFKVFAVFQLLAAAGVLAQLDDSVGNPCLFKEACLNGAKCTAPLDVAICQCASGFGGNRCENRVRVKTGRCKSGPFPGVFNCTPGCDNDFDCPGTMKCCNTDCERQCTNRFFKDPCESFCLNGGKCTARANAPYCKCPKGFTGDKCQDVTGTCPIFDLSLTTTVCGIVRCKSDTECRPNQKCCVLPCNLPYKFCVNAVFAPTIPPPTPQPELPCNLVDCRSGLLCRNIVECPNCSLKAKCFLPKDLPAGIDKTCQSYGYTQAILRQSSSYSTSYSQLLCNGPTSTNKCPPGSFCVNAGKKRQQCCSGKIDPVPRI